MGFLDTSVWIQPKSEHAERRGLDSDTSAEKQQAMLYAFVHNLWHVM